VPACPAGALTVEGFDPAAVVAAALQGGGAQLACAGSGQAGVGKVPCHKMTDARLLAALFAAGAGEIAILGTENCAACPAGDARPALAEAEKTLAKWFGAAAPRLVLAGAAHDAAVGRGNAAGRRQFLRGRFRALAPTPGATPDLPDFEDPVYDDGAEAAPARAVPYQALLADVRAALPFRPDGATGATGRNIDAACSGCMICAELCPTGALNDASGAAGGSFVRQVGFDAALCTNCTLCLKVCPMKAISARALRGPGAATGGRSILFARSEQTCANCGSLYAPAPGGGALCPGCENDRQMDDDWLDMLSG
jgi:ferredoxin